MEPTITPAGDTSCADNHERGSSLWPALGPADTRSLGGAVLGGVMYFALALLSFWLSRFGTGLATVWLPSAAAVALLLRLRLSNEAGFYALTFSASFAANTISGNPVDVALVFSVANMANLALVVGFTRRHDGPDPDIRELATLVRFAWYGGCVGPLVSAAIASLAMDPAMPLALTQTGPFGSSAGWPGALNWFLTESMGMILIVPGALLCARIIKEWVPPRASQVPEGTTLVAVSLFCTLIIFSQSADPLLFLIMPVTLVHAFRLGSAGMALHLTILAVVATAMTWSGRGPVAATTASSAVQLHLIQALVAANFLTGLTFVASLSGRDRLTKALSDRSRELALLSNSITDAVLKLDARGVCTYASPSVRDVLGSEPQEFVGHPLRELIHEDANARMADLLTRLLSGEVDRDRLTYRRRLDDPDGVAVFIEADCAIALDPITGAREGVVVSARDVTERVELELLLTNARRHAENAVSAKSDFLANMSHEIRIPMNGVLGFAELMLQRELDPETRRHTEMIVESGRSMMLLLNDILDLSRIEAGQITIDTGPIDLQATLDECVALHKQDAKKKGLELRLERDLAARSEEDLACARLFPHVVTDGLRLRQIALNLISNAVKFTESGAIIVSYWVSETQLHVRVRDTGIGISPTRLETIFEPFTQGETDTARRYGGTGLGLSISHELAARLGGYIDVESEPGVGSVFSLTLPTTRLAPTETPPNRLAPLPMPPSPEDLPPQARILLAEDHDVNRMLVAEMLERCGQNVAIAQDGNEAISTVMDALLRGRPFDLVLMDVQMPGCDGYSATRAIRGEGISEDVLPIIALTANAFPEDVAAAKEAGMQAHLAKPIIFSDLLEALERWLPTRIVEAPMDYDIGIESASLTKAGVTEIWDATVKDGSPARGEALHDPRAERSLVAKWLDRRSETVEAVRSALASGLIANENKRRGADQEEREELIRMVHKLAGAAASFGEAELGEAACALEQAMRGDQDERQCEALAFELLALADEPEDAPTPSLGLGR